MNRHIFVGLVAFAVLTAPAATAADRQPTIEDLAATVRDGRVYLDLEASNTLDAASIERLESGLPINFEYQIEIFTQRRVWLDNTRAATTVDLETVYDAVTREYTVTRRLDGQLFDVESRRSLDELEPLLANLEDFPVLQIADTPLGEAPILRVRLVTRRRSLLWLIPRPVASGWATTPLVLSARQPPTPDEAT